ncbi:hypothetical protein I7860_20180 [Pseudomonas tolaasii]|uniref:DNA-directed RNA polymerase subunit alpha C-terminal domain-containing protein n=1 Tax=Pseudomonas tolaasii TaxID=29442 RepID=UPI001C56D189|nr:DNA-directed RNA polymerase subunit alpha C-terminal domain-containing protein [Pseudomonas tolaasii]MBW1249000.1 hypothetical protein [Pseudomonas tolaasii]
MNIFESMGLTVRTINVLKCENILTLDELVKRSHLDLLQIPNMGKKSAQEIANAIQAHGLRLKDGPAPIARQAATESSRPLEMNLRDYFAAKAMQGYLANAWQAETLDSLGESSAQQMATVAEISYAMADAMLAARSA